ncbi:ParA family protein (plasmid) [Halorarum halophilum]|uniref:ParA family protein n=1 Tax=Halorarum halophilum TaxID=2743090 RepID=A0A7D5GHU1_9EURY|nr:ParA family protein [Halobaculum halophilum]QLG30048.1 ParA family protein [Halobaculum halophilum]
MTFRLALANAKGGVGKSTTTINLAGALADATNDVLLVDSDPQGFPTITLGFRDYYVSSREDTMGQILRDVNRFDEINDVIVEHEEYDLLPAHGSFFELEDDMHTMNRRNERLRLALDEIEHDYDYVLIDAPPNLGPLCDGALLAAGNLLFVTRPDSIATFSMNLMRREVDGLIDEYRRPIDYAGVVVNATSRNSISEERIAWFNENMGEDRVFQVPDTVAIEGAFDQQRSIFGYDPDNNHREKKATEVREIYASLADHLETNHA